MEKSIKIPKKRVSLDARKARGGYFFVAPFIIGIILIYLPILLDSIWFSFYDTAFETIDGQMVQYYKSAGIEYYKKALTDSSFISTP